MLIPLTGQWRTDEIGHTLHQKQQPVRIGESFQRDQLNEDNTCEGVIGGDEQPKCTGQTG